jgi:hypothetical protein
MCNITLFATAFIHTYDINTAVTACLKCLSKDEYRAAIDHLPSRWEKCVDSAGDYIE